MNRQHIQQVDIQRDIYIYNPYICQICCFTDIILQCKFINWLDGAEVAAEATDFFDSMEQSVASLEMPISVAEEPTVGTLSRSTSLNSQPGDQSWEVQSMGSLRSMIASKDSPLDLKTVPKMSQGHFIALWKTLYDMFPAQPEEQETYHCIASIGNIFILLYLEILL